MRNEVDDSDSGTPQAQRLPGSAPVRQMPEMAAVNKIVGPVAPPPPPPPPVAKSDAAMEPKVPPEKPQSDQPSSGSSACAAPNETAVETHRVDTEQATATKAALFRLYADVTSEVPDWTTAQLFRCFLAELRRRATMRSCSH